MGSSSSSVVSERPPLPSDAREQDAGEFDTPALTTGQGAQRLSEDAFGQAEVVADPRRLALGDVATESGESVLELAVLAHRLVALGLVGNLRHEQLLLLQLADQRVEAARREHPVLTEHVEITLARVLRQVAGVPAAGDLARVRLARAGEYAHGGRLAGAVSADESDAVAGLDAQVVAGGGDQGAYTGPNLEVGRGDHAVVSCTLVS